MSWLTVTNCFKRPCTRSCSAVKRVDDLWIEQVFYELKQVIQIERLVREWWRYGLYRVFATTCNNGSEKMGLQIYKRGRFSERHSQYNLGVKAIIAPRLPNSHKPKEFFDKIESRFGTDRELEILGWVNNVRTSWTSIGNQHPYSLSAFFGRGNETVKQAYIITVLTYSSR